MKKKLHRCWRWFKVWWWQSYKAQVKKAEYEELWGDPFGF
jgi:hypothetical protein